MGLLERLSNLSQSMLSQTRHHLITGHNKNQYSQVDEQNLNNVEAELFQVYPYYCDFPKPLLPPHKEKRDSCGREDSSMQLIHTKLKIKDDVNRYLELHKKHSAKLNSINCNLKNVKWKTGDKSNVMKLPRYMADTAEILQCDPDPYFSGNYNWYYSGGTLNGILLGTKNVLIFPYAQELIALPIELKDDLFFLPNYDSATKIPAEENIFQVNCLMFNNSVRVMTRQKNSCYLYNISISDKNKLNMMKMDFKESNVPYVSIDLDPSNLDKYSTADVKRHVEIYNINRANKISSITVPTSESVKDNWAFIKYDEANNNVLKFIDRRCVYHFDTRQSLDKAVLTMCPKNSLEECEIISMYIASCKSDYYSYIGSTHNLSLLDKRFHKTPVVKRWTHYFKSCPLFADVCFREQKEFVVIASQLVEEKAIVLNTWNNSEMSPETCGIPFTPPSCLETLNAAQYQGKCLNPHIKNRLRTCNTGCMGVVDYNSNDIFLLTQNSVNDIFYQTIANNEPLDDYSLENCKSMYKLKIWDRQLQKSTFQDVIVPLVVTKRTSSRNMLRHFTNIKLNAKKDNQMNDSHDFEPGWKKSIAELNQYRDILAPELLKHWEMIDDTPLTTTADEPVQKVLTWLEHQENKNQDEVINKTDVQIKIESNHSQEQQSTFAQSQNSQLYFDSSLTNIKNHETSQLKSKTPETSMRKKNLKRSTYVPGF